MNIKQLPVFIFLLLQCGFSFAQNSVFDGGSRFVNGFARIQKGNDYFYIDSLGKYAFDRILNDVAVLPAADEDGYLNDADAAGGQLPKYFMLVSKKEKLGIITLKNRWLLEPLYDSIDTRYRPEWVVTKGNKKSLFTSKGFLMPFKFEDLSELDSQHFTVKQHGKWGVYNLDKDKMVIPADYEAMDYCYGCTSKGNYVFAEKNGKWGVVDFNNEVLVPFAYEHWHMNMRSDEWVECLYLDGKQMEINLKTGKVDTCDCSTHDQEDDREPMADGFIRQRKNDRWGMLDAKEKLILDYTYDFIRYDSDSTGSYLPAPFVGLNYHDKFGIADTTGKLIIPPIYADWFSCLDNRFFLSSKHNGDICLFDLKGNTLLDKSYSNIEKWTKVVSGEDSVLLLKLTRNKKYGFYNTHSKKVIEPQYDYLYEYSETEGRPWLEAEKDHKRGYIDLSGKEVVPVAYDYIRLLENTNGNFAVVGNEDKAGVYDIRGQRLIIPLKYDGIHVTQDPSTWEFAQNKKTGLMDTSGHILCAPVYDMLYQLDARCDLLVNLDTARLKYHYHIWNIRSRKLEALAFDSVTYMAKGSILVVEDKGKWKLFDVADGRVVEGDYANGGYPDYIGPFEDGRAVVKKNNKSGYVDANGHLLVPLEHQILGEHFYDGLTLVADPVDSLMENFHYGFMDSTGKIIVPIIYDLPSQYFSLYTPDDYFKQGHLLLLKRDPQDDVHFWLGYATKTGEVRFPPAYDRISFLSKSAVYLVEKEGKKGIMDSLGHPLLPVVFDDFLINEGYGISLTGESCFPLLASKDKVWQYYTNKGKSLPVKVNAAIDFAPPYEQQTGNYYNYDENFGVPHSQKTDIPIEPGPPQPVEAGENSSGDTKTKTDSLNDTKQTDPPVIVAAGIDNAGLHAPVVEASPEVGVVALADTVKENQVSKTMDAGLEEKDGDTDPIIFTNVEKMPGFPGGSKAMERFFEKHTVVPEAAKGTHGPASVFVRFEVDKDGKVKNVATTFDPIGHGCSEEAQRVIRSMPKWKPGIQNGRAVNVWVTVGVMFKTK